MKISALTHVLIILSLSLFTNCNNDSKEKTNGNSRDDTATTKNDKATNKEKETTSAESNQQDYKYDPSVSVITGTITTEMFYGAPGFGENPETDKQEHPYLLNLGKPINVISTEKDGPNPTKNNISKIQLIWPDEIDMSKYKNKTVRLTGIFFAAHTGHHHTEVLMDVKELKEL